GLCWVAKGDLKTAREAFQKTEQINAKQADTAIAMGIIEHVEENSQQAIVQLERALTVAADTTDLLVHFLLANVYLSQKKWDEAAEHLQNASGFIARFSAENLDLKKHFKRASAASSAQTNLATLYLFKGWPDKGVEACDLALKRHKSNPIALYIKGKALMQKRELDQAVTQFQQLNRLAPQFAPAHYELAEIFVAQKSPEQAIREYQKVIALSPKDSLVHLRLGAVYELEGKDQDAVNAYKQVIALAPDSAIGYNQLAYHYGEKAQNLDDALSLVQKAVQLAPKNGAILDTLGWVHFKRGNYTEAVERLKQAIQGIPYSSTIRYHLGMAHFKSGDTQNALDEFQNALRISQQFPESDETKAMIQQIEAQ
ncbi:MAG: tetratricopeptide repeat protein, partial [Candidatus Poribacteria bacterium]|nr:tetratricopeptide repeat protein [Candidatus Poribacteria bacterium]